MTTTAQRVLVVYASDQGSTKEIAEFIASRLHVGRVAADVRYALERIEVDQYDAIVLGSAVHGRALLPAAERFVVDNAESLRGKPLWLFSVGLGPSLRGPVGSILRRLDSPRISRVRESAGVREYRAFAGVLNRNGASVATRAMLWLCGGRFGDHRDWRAIDLWAAGIARAVTTPQHAG
jgi:menaquinone-dependent protoporphyrinogen oxidase